MLLCASHSMSSWLVLALCLQGKEEGEREFDETAQKAREIFGHAKETVGEKTQNLKEKFDEGFDRTAGRS